MNGFREAPGFAFDLLPGATRDAPTRQLQSLLTLPVALKCGIRVVVAAAVSFNDQPDIAPKEIGHRAPTTGVERHVDLWLWQSGALAHAEEKDLHIAPRPLCQGMDFVYDHP